MCRFFLILIAGLFCSFPSFAGGGIASSRDVPREVEYDGSILKLNGVSERKKFGGGVEYIIALYLESASSNAEEVLYSSQKKSARMFFVEPLSYKNAKRVLFEDLIMNLDSSKFGGVVGRLEELMVAAPKDGFAAGDWAQFDYLPGKGTIVGVNGRQSSFIEGEDFYAALLMQWIGPRPVSRSLKREVLGLKGSVAEKDGLSVRK